MGCPEFFIVTIAKKVNFTLYPADGRDDKIILFHPKEGKNQRGDWMNKTAAHGSIGISVGHAGKAKLPSVGAN